MDTKFLSLLGCLLILLFNSYVNGACVALTDKQIMAVKEPLVQLLQLEDSNAQYGYVPKRAIKYIDELKVALIALVDARMACEAASTINPTVIQEDLLNTLHLSEFNEVEAIYGYDLELLITRASTTSNLLLVHINFGIPCGEDNILLAYQYRNKAWHRDLTWKSNPYQMITGAFGNYYDYLVLPHKVGEPPKIVIVHGSPWCTPSWEPLIFDVIKLGNTNSQQSTLLHQQLITYKGHSAIALKRLTNGFELQANVAMLDSDLLTRRGVYRYSVEADKIVREQPVAENPQDFVDEWLMMGDKEEVKKLSAKENIDQLMALQSYFKERNGYYGAMKYCEDEALYQVEITFNGTKDSDQEELRYFYVKPLKNGYLMHSSEIKPDPTCKVVNKLQ